MLLAIFKSAGKRLVSIDASSKVLRQALALLQALVTALKFIVLVSRAASFTEKRRCTATRHSQA